MDLAERILATFDERHFTKRQQEEVKRPPLRRRKGESLREYWYFRFLIKKLNKQRGKLDPKY